MRLDPLSVQEFGVWRTEVRDRFAELRAGTATMTQTEAAERAEQILGRLLPQGRATPEHRIGRLVDGADRDGDGADRGGIDTNPIVGDPVVGDLVVGDLWLHLPAAAADGAFLYDIRLTAEAVGRGLGPAAMDLAEQTARHAGAPVLRLNVFTGDAPTRRLVENRGYEATGTQMVRRLDSRLRSAASAGGVLLSLVTPAQYEVFIAGQEAHYAAEIEASGMTSPAHAAAKAAADMAELLPAGRDTPHHFIFMASAGAADVGWLWLQVEPGVGRAYVFDIVVHEQFRRRGHGRSVMLAAEREARERGATTLGLNVFGHNHGARALYDSLGYQATEVLLRKVL